MLRAALAAAFLAVTAGPSGPAAAAEDPEQCLALSLYFEARDAGRAGMEAVGWVVLNRIDHPEFPDEICAVVKEGGETPPCTFNWWCDGRSDRPEEAEAWALARDVAGDLLADPPADPTDGALFFHARGHETRWHASRPRTRTLGDHVFYR